MKRIFTLILASLFTYGLAIAQTNGGPDAYGYTWFDSNDLNGQSINWIDISTKPSAVLVTGLDDDNFVGPFPIGFDFPYYWYDVDQFWIGSNGYIKFDPVGQMAAGQFNIPSATQPNDVLSILGSDVNCGTTGANTGNPVEVYYWSNTNNDSLIVSWIDAPFYFNGNPSYAGSNTFQIIITTVDSSITYQYLNQTGTTTATGSNFMVIGIENNSGTIGLTHSIDMFPANNYVIRFDPPASTTFMVFDASTNWAANSDNAGFHLSNEGDGFDLTAEISNKGNQALGSYEVFGKILNDPGTTIYSDTVISMASTPGQSESISFGSPFMPTLAQTYTYSVKTNLSGDATISNDEQNIEVVAVDTNVTNIMLTYEDGSFTGSIGWTGGNGGLGMKFTPPFYPTEITEAQAFITANAAIPVGFSMLIYDDDGPNGEPGTLLDSVFVSAANVLVGFYNPVIFSSPVQITDGSFYVGWFMGGEGINIGTNGNTPISNQSYEILGSSWAPYRSRSSEDVMVNVTIKNLTIGVDEVKSNNTMGDVYPNPSSNLVYVDYNFEKPIRNLHFKIYDMSGKMIANNKLSNSLVGEGSVELNVTGLPAGNYIINFEGSDSSFKKKFTVAK